MRRKRRYSEEAHHEQHLAHDESNWLVSYADLMTLLFGFFVLMYSLSRVDHQKFDVVRKDLVKYFGGPLKENPGALNLKHKVEALLVQLNGKEGFENELVGVEIFNNQVRVTLNSDFIFQSGSAELTTNSVFMVDRISQELKKLKVESVEVEGHTDAEPIHSAYFPSNWELSSARAARVVRRMVENGLSSSIMVAKGFAEAQPSVPHRNEKGEIVAENKIKNRRVVLFVSLPDLPKEKQDQLNQSGFRAESDRNSSFGRNISSIRNNLPNGTRVADSLGVQGQQLNENHSNMSPEEIRKKIEEAHVRYQQAEERIKRAQEMEKSLKELDTLTKKAQELEMKVETVESRVNNSFLENNHEDVLEKKQSSSPSTPK